MNCKALVGCIQQNEVILLKSVVMPTLKVFTPLRFLSFKDLKSLKRSEGLLLLILKSFKDLKSP